VTAQQAFATALKSATIAQKPFLIGLFTSGEAKLSVILHAVLDGVKPGGVPGAVYGLIRGPVEAEVDALLNQYGPEEAYAFLLAEVTAYAKSQGV
jgi:hypothetical protein